MSKGLGRKRAALAAITKIMLEVCIKHGIAPSEFLSTLRAARFVKARQEAAWRARIETSASFPAIAQVFMRDHSSIMHSVHRYQDKIKAREACYRYPHDSQIVRLTNNA